MSLNLFIVIYKKVIPYTAQPYTNLTQNYMYLTIYFCCYLFQVLFISPLTIPPLAFKRRLMAGKIHVTKWQLYDLQFRAFYRLPLRITVTDHQVVQYSWVGIISVGSYNFIMLKHFLLFYFKEINFMLPSQKFYLILNWMFIIKHSHDVNRLILKAVC